MEQVGVKKESDYFKLKILGDPASATSKTYELKLALFGKDEPEEFHIFNFWLQEDSWSNGSDAKQRMD